jgi:futalosine hydrolase
MRILVVAATEPEIAPLVSRMDNAEITASPAKKYRYNEHDIEVLITGVGMVATAAWCATMLSQNRFDVAFNFGVCGTFRCSLEVGQVVHVVSDRIAELGAEDDEKFLTLQELGLSSGNEFPLSDGRVINAKPPRSLLLDHLVRVDGITVNTVHGNEQSISSVSRRFQPQVESMEGAAFMYACLIHQVPFAQVRAISNVVEKRNREAWNLPEAITNLTEIALKILEEI